MTPTTTDSLWNDALWRRSLQRRLVAWFRRHARDLPWRRSRDPYRVWVSEIMLQQTQVATVGPYFQRFVAAFPDVAALAAADEREVLRLWEGLGYYRRARQMHQAAQRIVNQWDGQFPRDFTAVLSLPGIGRYTAGAILSIAFDQRQPILEANSIRVLSRLAACRGDPWRAEGQRTLWKIAEAILPRRNVGAFNQAVMELGSKVCTPAAPRCSECPVAACCQALAGGIVALVPPPKRRAAAEAVREVAVVVRRGNRVLLRQCGTAERWAGLWDFPRFPLADGLAAEDAIPGEVRRMTGIAVRPGGLLTTLRHSVTRFRITLECYEAASGGGGRLRGACVWVAPAALAEYPLSVTARRIGRLLGP